MHSFRQTGSDFKILPQNNQIESNHPMSAVNSASELDHYGIVFLKLSINET